MKSKKSVIFILVFLVICQTFAFATPSDWAVALVNEANDIGIVPAEVNSEYQNTVKRYEYVLMALKVLESNGVIASDNTENPFSDIYAHPYKDAIVKAYHSGLVGGYTDGTFRPDQNINRQEITALVYNLVKAINGDVSLPLAFSTYSDQAEIHTWARGFVEFSYANQIMSGVGKKNGFDTIDPLGNATREQAIILLLKVYKNNALLHDAYAGYDSDFGQKTSDDIFESARSVGFNIMDLATEQVDEGLGSFFYINDESMTLTMGQSEIEVANNKYDKIYSYRTSDLNNDQALNVFKNIILTDLKNVTNSPTALINQFKEDESYVLNDTKASVDTSVYSEMDGLTRMFIIKYKLSK